MPSFDIVSEITLHEVRNAVENANRVLSTRYDFRGVEAVIELNEKNETIKIKKRITQTKDIHYHLWNGNRCRSIV